MDRCAQVSCARLDGLNLKIFTGQNLYGAFLPNE